MAPSQNRKTFLTGASGRLGHAVLTKLGGRMVPVVPLVRSLDKLPPGTVHGQVTDFSSGQLGRILQNAGTVIHIAGSVDTLDESGMREANVELTRRIVEATPEDCRIIFASSISVYGKKPAESPAVESTPTNPDSSYARSKYEAERLVSIRPNNIILRIGTIYGPGFEDYFRVLRLIEQGKMRIIGDGNNRIPFVHVDDVADAFVNAITRVPGPTSKQPEGTYLLAGDPLTQNEIYSIAAKAFGVPPPSARVGLRTALLMASWQAFRYRHLGGKKPWLTGEHIDILGYDRIFDCGRARGELGFSPRPLADGIRAMVEEYKRRKATSPS